jgi:aryl-alcohol dehydrogenase-like predicted oxidoreductase
MKYRTIGADPKTRREVSVLSLGAMHFGTATDEATSFAILDRYVEAGGTFIDTSGNYAFWANGTQGGESEELLAWLIGGEVPMIPLVGASSPAQLDESLAAVDLELTPGQRARLDAAG